MSARCSSIIRNCIMSRLLLAILTHTGPDINHPAPLNLDLLVQSVNLAVRPESQSDPKVPPIPMLATRSQNLAIYTHVHQVMTLFSPRNGNEMTRLPRTRRTLEQSTHGSICLLYGISFSYLRLRSTTKRSERSSPWHRLRS